MALSASTVFEIRQGGSDTNGGGYVSGGTDWTLQDGAQYSVADGVTAGTTTITSATAAFGTDVVGNLISVSGGTGSVVQGWYQIISRTNATTIVVDRSTGLTAGTGVTLKIGGAFATPGVLTSVTGGIGGSLVSGQKAWVKYNATAMNCSTSTAGPAGPMTLPGVSLSVEGYDVTRGDRTGNRPSYKWTASAPGAATLMMSPSGSASQCLVNLQLDGNSVNNVVGFGLATRDFAIECVAVNFNGTAGVGFTNNSSSGWGIGCKADTCTTGFSNASFADCDARACTTGFSLAGSLDKCLARACTTGFNPSIGRTANCTAEANATGFSFGNATSLINCLATNNTVVGYALGSNLAIVRNCASYNNLASTSGTPLFTEGPWAGTASPNWVTSLSSDPYVNKAGSDYRLNATAGGGADLRAVGLGVYGQTDSQDVGALQHTDPAGGPGGSYIAMP